MKIAALYARVSTDNQRKDQTIDSQIDEVKERIRTDGHTLSPACEFKDDGWSGAYLDRPGLDALRDAAKKGEFQTLYVYDRGRLARRFVYQEVILDELRKYGVEFITLHDRKAETAEDTILQGMQGLFQEYERVKTMERTRRGKLFKARNGFIVNGPAAFGYTYVPKTPAKQSHWVVNDEESKIVNDIFRWVADEGLTVYGVVKRLDELGILPRKQKRKQWAKSSVARILKNEAYIGKTYYNRRKAVEAKNPLKPDKYRKNKKTGRILRPRDKWIKIVVPKIVSDELFYQTQEQLKRNYRFAARSKKLFYFLTGVLWCECGSRMTGEAVRSGDTVHQYYRCTDRLKHQPLPGLCESSGVNIKRIDDVVWKQFQNFLTDPLTLQKQAQRWLEGKQTGLTEYKQQRLEDVEHQLEFLQGQERRHAESYAQELISFDVFKSLIGTVKLKRTGLTNELNQLQYELHKPNLYSNVTVDDVMRRTPKVVEKLLENEKRDVILALIDKIVVDYDRKEAKVFGFLPLPQLQEAQDWVSDVKSWNCGVT